MTVREGGCLCGDVRFEVTGRPVVVGHCHCRDCQKTSGGGHVSFAFYLAEHATVNGEPAAYDVPANAGGTTTRVFCPRCGSRLFARSSRRPGLLGIVVAAFDEPDDFTPSVSLYVSRRPPWDTLAEATTRFDEDIPPRQPEG